MVNQFFNHGKHTLGLGDLEFDTADWRILLFMSIFSFATEKDKVDLDAMALDEYDGANYARQALANETYVKDAANDRSELNCDPLVFSNLGIGSRQCTGALLFEFITADTDHVPFLKIDDGGFPFDGTGSDNTINPDAEGLVQI